MADNSFTDMIDNITASMRRNFVSRLRLSDGTEIELHPVAFAAPALPAEPPATPDEDVCACGHSLEIEHNESGCLMGCSHETCAAKAGAP